MGEQKITEESERKEKKQNYLVIHDNLSNEMLNSDSQDKETGRWEHIANGTRESNREPTLAEMTFDSRVLKDNSIVDSDIQVQHPDGANLDHVSVKF